MKSFASFLTLFSVILESDFEIILTLLGGASPMMPLTASVISLWIWLPCPREMLLLPFLGDDERELRRVESEDTSLLIVCGTLCDGFSSLFNEIGVVFAGVIENALLGI